MNDSCYRRTPAVVDVGHGPGNGTGCRDTSKERGYDVGHSLCDQLHVRVVPFADHTIGNGCGQQGFDGAQHGNGKCGGEQQADAFEIEPDRICLGELAVYLEPVADRFNSGDPKIVLHHEHDNGH